MKVAGLWEHRLRFDLCGKVPAFCLPSCFPSFCRVFEGGKLSAQANAGPQSNTIRGTRKGLMGKHGANGMTHKASFRNLQGPRYELCFRLRFDEQNGL